MSAKFNLVKRGYDTSEVDSYIETIENVVRSYKEKDKAIKNAILSAQIAADNILSEAREQADEIIANSLNLVNEIKDSISEQNKLIDVFQNDYNAFVKKYLVETNESSFAMIRDKIRTLENYFTKLMNEKEIRPNEETSVADKLMALLNDEN